MQKKKHSYRYSVKNITKTILCSLFAAGVVGAVVTMPGLALLGKEFISWKKYNRSRLRLSLKRLHNQRMINFSEKPDGQIRIEFTEGGNKRVLQYKFDEMKIKTPPEWDGLWRMVIFDIPDKKKRARESLRAKLKTLGFHKLQESIFVYPYDCKNEMDFIKEFYNISPFVKFITAKEIDDDFRLRNIFLLD